MVSARPETTSGRPSVYGPIGQTNRIRSGPLREKFAALGNKICRTVDKSEGYRTSIRKRTGKLSTFGLRRPLFAMAAFTFSGIRSTGFDSLSIPYLRQEVPYRYIAFTSFTSLSPGCNIDFAA